MLVGLATAANPDPPTRAWCFESGLRVVHERAERRPLASTLMWVPGGSRAEGPGEDGEAHLVEHLWFRSRDGGRSVDAQLDDLGARSNAFTTRDAVLFTTTVPESALDSLLAIEARRLIAPLQGVTEADLISERAIVNRERSQRDLKGNVSVNIALYAGLFPDHSYSHAPIGTEESLGELDLAHVVGFANEMHVGTPVSLMVVSSEKHLHTLERVKTHFGDAAATEVPCRSQIPEPIVLNQDWVFETLSAPVHEKTLHFAWAFEPKGVLAAEFDARLIAHIARRVMKPLNVACTVDTLHQAHVVHCSVPWEESTLPVEDLREIEQVLTDTATHYLRPKGTSSFDDFLSYRMVSAISRLDEVGGGITWRLREKLEMFHLTGHAAHTAAILNAEATMDSIWLRTHVVRNIGQGRRAAVLVTPAKAEGTGGVVHGERVLTEASSWSIQDLAALPEIEVHDLTLENGLEVTLIQSEGLPVFRASLILPGGAGRAETPSVDAVTRALMTSIYAERNLGILAARRGVTFEDTDDGWTWRSVGLRADHVLSFLWARVEQAEIGSGRPRLPDSPTTDVQRAGLLQHRHLGGALFPGERVSKGMTRQWLERVLTPHGAHLILVGDFEPSLVRKTLALQFGRWEGEPGPEPIDRSVAPATDGAVWIVPQSRPRSQAILAWACAIDDLPGTSLMIEALQHRVTQDLREERGITYGVHVHYDPGASAVTLQTVVPHEVAGLSIDRIRAALAELQSGTLPPNELQRIKQQLGSSMATDFATSQDLQFMAEAAVRRGVSASTLWPDPTALEALDMASVSQAAKTCTAEIITLIGDPIQAKKSLDASGIDATVVKSAP